MLIILQYYSRYQSQAIKPAGQVWLSGKIPADAKGNLITGSVTEKTQAINQNTEAIFNEAGSGLDRAVKVVVSSTSLLLFSLIYSVQKA